MIRLAFMLTLMTLAACGSGGNEPTTATLTVVLNGELPVSKAISGVVFTLTLPPNVTPSVTNGNVDSGVVTPSGTFAGGGAPSVIYTAATASDPGTLKIALVNTIQDGVTQVGEVATIFLQLSNGAAPSAADFQMNAVSVIDVFPSATIAGMGANTRSVMLQ